MLKLTLFNSIDSAGPKLDLYPAGLWGCIDNKPPSGSAAALGFTPGVEAP